MRKFCIILLVAVATNTYAQTESVDTTNINERIQTIQTMLDKSKTGVDVWWYGWLGAYSTATVGQGIVYFISNDTPTRQDMALGAGTTILGAAFQLISPLNTGKDADQLAQMPENTIDEKITKLKIAEDFLKTNALKEQEGRSWKIHALNTAVNLSSGLITWLGFKRTVWDGVSNFLLNTAITETQIWTQPTRTLKNYRNYCRKYINKEISVNEIKPEYLLRTYPGGASFVIVF
jgi:hypothetical protein